MPFPKLGMEYSDVRRRVKRLVLEPRGDPYQKQNVVDSLKNQLRLHEGEKALTELEADIASLGQTSSLSLSGAGGKQVGWGEGKRLGEGKWKYIGNEWCKID